jgi:sterol desaturase/sphingolipid hydroxylase (fatty acid hydroxylase superfamily)
MFYLVPHPNLDRPRRGSPRMFVIDWVEKYFSRVRPWHVVSIWGPFTAYLLWHAARDPQISAAAIVGLFLLGVFGWTFLEYLLHRFLFHFKPNENVEWQRDASFLIHGIHHDYPYDPDRLVMPPTVTAVLAVLLWFPVHALFGPHLHYPFFAGLVAGYVGYDLTHYYLHHAVPKTPLGRWMRKYHLVHHFSTPNVRYGITSPIWDFVFRTYPRDKYQGFSETEIEAGAR